MELFLTGMWEANRQYLEHLVKLLTAATSATTTAQQRQIAKSMEDFCMLPECGSYLLIVLSSPPETGVDETIRSMAGLILKNNIRRREEVPVELVRLMQQCSLLRLLGDRTPLVRSTVGTLLAALALRLGRNLFTAWPTLLPTLGEMAASQQDPAAAIAASEAIAMICEDAADELACGPPEQVDRLLYCLTCLLQMDASSEGVRVGALKALNCFILQDDLIEGPRLTTLLQILSHRATVDHATAMRRVICQSLNLLLEGHTEAMRSALPSVLEYMLQSVDGTRNDASVALEACEFWLSLAERDALSEVVASFLPRLLPLLMTNIVYTDDDPELEANEAEASMPDRAEDIRPRHHAAVLHDGRTTTAVGGKKEAGEVGEDEVGGAEVDSDEDAINIDDELFGSWTLRKCSAATIDILATTMPEDAFLPLLLPLINQALNSDQWKQQEVGILALGAISEGCIDSMASHISQVIPYLINSFASPIPVVRAIAAWTVSRYAPLISDPSIVAALINLMGDGNKRVQHAACTAVSVFADKAPTLLAANMKSVMGAAQYGLASYQARNLTVLYDLLGSIADSVEGGLDEFSSILPPLMEKWVHTAETDYALFALLECVCSIAVSSGALMAPYARVIFERAILMIENTLKSAILSTSPDVDVDFDFCIVALDVIGGLVQGLGQTMAPLMSSKFFTLLERCCDEPRSQVRQSAFALLGDLAGSCPMALTDEVVSGWVIKAIAANVDVLQEDATHGSANNSVWALGELVLAGKFPQLAIHLPLLFDRLCQFLTYTQPHRTYLENVAVTLGRCLALIPPSSSFPAVLPRWCEMMLMVKDPKECESAWIPVINILLQSPSILNPQSTPALLHAIGYLRNSTPRLEESFRSIVQLVYAQLIGPSNWLQYRTTAMVNLSDDFEARFNILQTN